MNSMVTKSIKQMTLNQSTEAALCACIYRLFGLIIQEHQRKYLNDAVFEACRLFDYTSPELYLNCLNSNKKNTAEIEHLISRITIGETYFFRDSEQMRFLSEHCLPALISKKTTDNSYQIRIWSAGCASGEEAYTIAIVLSELIPDLTKWSIHLIGTDINNQSLHKATNAVYSEWSMRATPDNIKKRYFTRRGKSYHPKKTLVSMVNFSYFNLLTDIAPSVITGTIALDLIICRNVFIYFDAAACDKIIKKFSGSLVDDGILLLGASDYSANNVHDMKQIMHGEVIFYKKSNSGNTCNPRRGEFITESVIQLGENVEKQIPLSESAVCETEDDRVAMLGLSGRGSHVGSEQEHAAAVGLSDPQGHTDLLELTQNSRWLDVIGRVDQLFEQQNETTELLHYKAKALANIGQWQAAIQICEQCLCLDAMDKHCNFLHGLLMFEADDLLAAEQSFQRTIYLDSGFIEAFYRLGLVQIRMKNKSRGIKNLKNALVIIRKSNPETEVHEGQGMTYARLAEILSEEIDMYSAE